MFETRQLLDTRRAWRRLHREGEEGAGDQGAGRASDGADALDLCAYRIAKERIPVRRDGR